MRSFGNSVNERPDPKRERILEGAKQVFLAYGYSRTTMDDIARAAEVSRPALYLQFRNKADIFRAVTRVYLDQSAANAQMALSGGEPLDVRILDALDRACFDLYQLIEDSPHGEELVDVNHRIAADVVAEWKQGLTDAFAGAIDTEARRRNASLEAIDLSGHVLAEMIFDILEGLKTRGLCGTHARSHAGRFVTLIELALGGK